MISDEVRYWPLIMITIMTTKRLWYTSWYTNIWYVTYTISNHPGETRTQNSKLWDAVAKPWKRRIFWLGFPCFAAVFLSLPIRSGHDGTLPDEGKPSRKPPKTRGFLTTREIQARRCGEICDRFPTCSSDSWWIAQIESQMSQLKIMRSEPKPGVMGFTNFVEEHA